MPGRRAVKPDPGVWLPLLEEYHLTSLPHETMLEGTLRDGMSAASPEVLRALDAWPSPAYLHHEGGTTRLALVYHARDERGRGPWIHLALFAATLVTTLGAGALMMGLDPFATEVFVFGQVSIPYPSGISWTTLAVGAPFALPFLSVLLAHEMGHYVAARVHKVRATLPYFIPFPPYLSIIGTIGAFIRLKGPTLRRAVLFDVGAAGPLASFAVSVPLLAVGLAMSDVVPGRATVATPFVIQFAGQPVFLGSGAVTHVLAELLGPVPVGAAPIFLHPLALVGWLGLFVTALNLLPLGQLDGGHVLYALLPRQQAAAAKWFMVALLPLGLVWWGWWAWAVLIAVLHRGRMRHPRVIQLEHDIGWVRRALGWALILIFFLTFVPVPLDL